MFLIILLPVINLLEGVNTKTMIATGEGINTTDPAAFAFNWQAIMWVMSALFMLALTYYYKPALQGTSSQKKAVALTLTYLVWYIIISNVISAIWLTPAFSSQHLYWVNLVVLWLLLRKNTPGSVTGADSLISARWPFTVLKWWIAAILCILLLSYIAISIGYVHPNAQIRFE